MLLNDIRTLSNAISEETFDTGVQLFKNKWETVNKNIVSYMDKVWFTEFKHWYVGALPRVPITNNALEAFNRVLKDQFSFRAKLDVGPLLECLKNCVAHYSKEYALGKRTIAETTTITTQMYKEGHMYLKQNQPKQAMVGTSRQIFVSILGDDFSTLEAVRKYFKQFLKSVNIKCTKKYKL